MIIYLYPWEEGLLHGSNGTMQDLRNWCLIDILLPGPTTLGQLLCSVISKGTKVKVVYTPPGCLMNSRRTAAQVAGNMQES